MAWVVLYFITCLCTQAPRQLALHFTYKSGGRPCFRSSFSGNLRFRADGKRISIASRPAQSLFAFLILTAGTVHRREKLAGMFWPDTSDENARKNLRQELWRIRKALAGQQTAEKDYLLADEFTLAFNRDAEYWLDVSQMERPDLDLRSLLSNLPSIRANSCLAFMTIGLLWNANAFKLSLKPGWNNCSNSLSLLNAGSPCRNGANAGLHFGNSSGTCISRVDACLRCARGYGKSCIPVSALH